MCIYIIYLLVERKTGQIHHHVTDDFGTFFASKITALRLSLSSESEISLPSDCADSDQSFLHRRGEQDLFLSSSHSRPQNHVLLTIFRLNCSNGYSRLCFRPSPRLCISITSGVFPETMKHAIVLLTIKKLSLDHANTWELPPCLQPILPHQAHLKSCQCSTNGTRRGPPSST